MHTNIVFTLTGTDRIGIVEEVTRLLLDRGGNVETSRMARLGGWFAILMLVSMPSEQLAGLDQDIQELIARGYEVTTRPATSTYAGAHAGWLPFRIDVRGADHEGIVHEVARYLSQRGINIESMDTGVTTAPVSGSPLFTMTALVAVPPELANQGWQAALRGVADQLNVDVSVSAAPGTSGDSPANP